MKMKKNVKCVAQTINLSQPKTCARPRQVQKLVNADVMIQCPESVKTPYKTSCRPIPIRICTRSDMQRILPPRICDCPQKLPPDTAVKKLCRMLKYLVKTGIAGGFVYWTMAEGFWGDGRESENLYQRVMATVAPAFVEATNIEDIKLPHMENMKHNLLDAYNRLILRLIGLVIVVPVMLEEKIYDLLYPCYPENDGQSNANNRNRAGIERDKKGAK